MWYLWSLPALCIDRLPYAVTGSAWSLVPHLFSLFSPVSVSSWQQLFQYFAIYLKSLSVLSLSAIDFPQTCSRKSKPRGKELLIIFALGLIMMKATSSEPHPSSFITHPLPWYIFFTVHTTLRNYLYAFVYLSYVCLSSWNLCSMRAQTKLQHPWSQHIVNAWSNGRCSDVETKSGFPWLLLAFMGWSSLFLTVLLPIWLHQVVPPQIHVLNKIFFFPLSCLFLSGFTII